MEKIARWRLDTYQKEKGWPYWITCRVGDLGIAIAAIYRLSLYRPERTQFRINRWSSTDIRSPWNLSKDFKWRATMTTAPCPDDSHTSRYSSGRPLGHGELRIYGQRQALLLAGRISESAPTVTIEPVAGPAISFCRMSISLPSLTE